MIIFKALFFFKYHYETPPFGSSDKLVVIHAPQVQVSVRQPVIEVPQVTKNDHVYQVVDEEQVPQQDDNATLRRSTRAKMMAIPSDYVVYLQESYYNIGAKNDPETFSHAISSKELNLWDNAMKDEMDSMACNKVWDIIELHDAIKSIRCRWVFKTKKNSQS